MSMNMQTLRKRVKIHACPNAIVRNGECVEGETVLRIL